MIYLIIFLVVYVLYQLLILRANKRELVEVRYITSKFKIDSKDKKSLNQAVALVSTLDITIIVFLMSLVKLFYLQLLVASFVTMGLAFISFNLLGIIYKKRK